MSLRSVMEMRLSYCEPSTSIAEVARIMEDDSVGAVLVVDSGAPVGILTDRDIVLRCVATDRSMTQTKAETVMTRGVETISWSEGIYRAALLMKQAGTRRLVVVDDSGNAVGLLSFDDLFDLLSEELSNLRQAVAPRKSKFSGQSRVA